MAGFEEKGPQPFLFDFDQFVQMEADGMFAGREGHAELIEGVVLQMSPAGADHTKVISRLMGRFFIALEALDTGGLMAPSQGTLRIDNHSAPEPDVFIARSVPGRKYFQSEDAELVIEVTVTTFEADHSIKRPMYARAGIPELWLVEPSDRVVHVYRKPEADGAWREMFTVTEGCVSPLFAPQISIALDDVFQSL